MTGSSNTSRLLAAIAAAVLLQLTLLLATAAAASEADEEWEFELTPYLWTPDISGKTPDGTDIDLSFNQIYKNLDMVFMGAFVARQDKWSYLVDTVYMDISDSDEAGDNREVIGGISTNLKVDVAMKASITTLAAGYNLVNEDGMMLDVIGGARYNWIEVDLKLDGRVTGLPMEIRRKINEKDSDGVWDGIVGARGNYQFADSWYVPYYADVGAGESDLTYQALAGVGYKFDWGEIAATYRYLYYDFDSHYLLDDVTIKGPLFSATFRF